MAGVFENIFTTKFLYISTLLVIGINIVFFPDLLNNKDIKLLDMSYLMTNKQDEVKVNQPDLSLGNVSYLFLILSLACCGYLIYSLFQEKDIQNIKEDDEESLINLSSKRNNNSTVDYSLIETDAGDY